MAQPSEEVFLYREHMHFNFPKRNSASDFLQVYQQQPSHIHGTWVFWQFGPHTPGTEAEQEPYLSSSPQDV